MVRSLRSSSPFPAATTTAGKRPRQGEIEPLAVVIAGKQHRDSPTLFADPLECVAEGPARALPAGHFTDIAQGVGNVNPHQCWLVRGNRTEREGEMGAAADRILVAVDFEFAEAGVEAVACGAGYGAFVGESVMDQIGDGADPEPVGAGEFLEVRAAGHAARLRS